MCKSLNIDKELKKTSVKRFSVSILTVLLIGCNNIGPINQVKIPTKTFTESKGSSFPEDVTTTPSVTQASAKENNEPIKQICLNINSDLTPIQNVAKTGTVALYDMTEKAVYLLNLETSDRYALPLQNHNISPPIMHVSPNGNYLAYLEDISNDSGYIEKQIVWVVDSEGNTLASQSINPEVVNEDWWRWLDDQQLEFNFRSITPQDGSVAIFSPFQSEWRYITNFLPNFYEDFELNPSSWLVSYNSNLNKVIYLGQVQEFVDGQLLWDVTSQQTIWQTSESNASTKAPKWSPYSEMLAIMKDDFLYIFTSNGKVTSTPKLGNNSEIKRIVWSPDGKYIATLTRRNSPTTQDSWILYDTQNSQYIDYCIKGDNLLGVRPPLWSDDNSFLYIRLNTMHADGPQEELILIDIKNHIGYQLPDNFRLLAWMKSIQK